jgi:hypothetical protein
MLMVWVCIFYKNELKRIKELRNKVHLQSSEGIADADYAVFEILAS